jgi:protocatechuate 3,4-dioxygenase beta subunit
MALLVSGCSETEKDETQDQDTNTDVTENDRFGDFVYVTEPPVGDLDCFEGGYDATEEWVSQTPIESSEASLSGTVLDFESDDPVTEATLEVFYSNEAYGAPDATFESDGSGSLSGTITTCAPYTYRVSTDPVLEETKITIQANQIEEAGESVNVEYNSVSSATYAVIPSLLGVSPDADKGVVAGTAYDCNGDPVEGAQVIVRNASGTIPESMVVKYFVQDFPNRNQEWTSADGLWVAINIPEGDWMADMYVSDGAGGHFLMGSTNVKVIAGSINISSIYTSFGDGVKYPDACLAGD